MQSLRPFNLSIFLAALNIFIYSIAFLNIFATLILEVIVGPENPELNSDHRYNFYLTLYKTLLSIFSLIMITTSVNLLRGLAKKSIALINPWFVLSFCVLVYQAIFLLDQVLFCLAYGYTVYSPLTLLGLAIIFGLHTFCIRKMFKVYLNLHRDNILQREEISLKNSSLKSEKYLGNLAQNDSAILSPLNEDELTREYESFNGVNLNQFEI